MEKETLGARRPRKESTERKLKEFHKLHNQKILPSKSGKTVKIITYSPEGRLVEISEITKRPLTYISWLLLPRYNKENYNNHLVVEKNLPKKFMGKKVKVPEPLPLPQGWRKLLPEKVTNETFFFDFENDWVHTHFYKLYKADFRKYGSVFIEPSNDGKKVFFIGTGEYACHYFLELDK